MTYFVGEYDADVVFLSETYLRLNTRFSLPAYATYRIEVSNSRPVTGATAILIHRRLSHRLLPTPQSFHIEATSVTISVADTKFRLVSVYKKPGPVPTPQELDALLNNTLPTIAVGDMNCKHTSWNSHTVKRRGRALYQYASTRPYSSSSA